LENIPARGLTHGTSACRAWPAAWSLKPGELRIEFYGAEDLAAKLFELSQAMANDWQAFARAVEDEARPAASPDR
jgi:hypothetical protein